MFFSGNTKNWNSINITLLKENNQAEISRLYSLTKEFFMFFFKGDEELYHDLILRLLSRIHLYEPQRSSFHNFVYTMAVNMRNANHRNKKKAVQCSVVDFTVLQTDLSIEYPEWSIEHKVELEMLIIMLSPSEREFLERYLNNKKELTEQRMKYSRIIKKLKQNRALLPPQ